jgi:hypothetical protein
MLNLARDSARQRPYRERDVGNLVATAPDQVHIEVDRQGGTKGAKGSKHDRGSSRYYDVRPGQIRMH